MDLPREMASDALAILDHTVSAVQGVSRVMVKFRSIVVDCCPSLASQEGVRKEENGDERGVEEGRENRHQTLEERKAALAVSMDIAKMMTSVTSSSSEVSWFRDAADAILDVDWREKSRSDNLRGEEDAVDTMGEINRRAQEDEQIYAQRLLVEKMQVRK